MKYPSAEKLFRSLVKLNKSKGQKVEFTKIIRLVQISINHDFIEDETITLYERYFKPSIPNEETTPLSRISKERYEKIIMDRILSSLKAANFSPLENIHVNEDREESLHLIPTQLSVAWSQFDKTFVSMIRKEFNAAGNSEYDNFCFLFYRGIGSRATRGYFYGEKFNEGLTRLFNFISSALYEKIVLKPKRIVLSKLSSFYPTLENKYSDIVRPKMHLRQDLSRLPFKLNYLLRRVTLKVPTYLDLVLVYRNQSAGYTSKTKDSSDNENSYFAHTKIANRANIHVQRFKDVPFSDIKVLLPLSRIYFRKSDKIFFGFTAILLSGTIIPLFEFSFNTLLESYTWLVASTASGLAFSRLLSRVLTSYLYYNAVASAVFGELLVAKECAALSSICFTAREERIKECMIIIFCLLKEGSPVSLDVLNNKCNQLLTEIKLSCWHFHCKSGIEFLEQHAIISKSKDMYHL